MIRAWVRELAPLVGVGAGVAVGVSCPPLSGGTLLGLVLIVVPGAVWVRRAVRGDRDA